MSTAASVQDALNLISSQPFDALLSDLHMPGAGDGLTVVNAMRHSHPKAVTIIFSGYPEMKEAAAAILLQADQILVKLRGGGGSDAASLPDEKPKRCLPAQFAWPVGR